MIYLACYKGNSQADGIKGIRERLEDALIRLFTRGKYSHCELAVCIGTEQRYNATGWELPPRADDPLLYLCYTSSPRDGGVRRKTMPLPAEKWDLIPIPNLTSDELVHFWHQTNGKKYDYLGALGVVLPFKQKRNQYFCSEWCASVLDLEKPHTFSPNGLYRYVSQQNI